MSNSQLFREKSLDRIASPEQLHDYLRVTSPRLWMAAAAAAALLLGLIILSATTGMDSTIPVKAKVQYGSIDVELPLSAKGAIRIGMPLRINGKETVIDFFFQDEESLIMIAAQTDPELPDGVYDAEIVTESVTPANLLMD